MKRNDKLENFAQAALLIMAVFLTMMAVILGIVAIVKVTHEVTTPEVTTCTERGAK